jgi:hypothetical protein
MPSMFELTIPALTRGLGIMTTYIDFADQHAQAAGLSQASLIDARLAPDMLPFGGQVQRASDNAKFGVARLTGVAAPSFNDNEATFDELRDRVSKTTVYLLNVDPEKFEGSDTREVELKFKSVSGIMSGHAYLTKFLLPNFYFHIATAHGILRNQGLNIGKQNYLGGLD